MLARLEVTAAEGADQPVVANLLELYIHDFSEFVAVDIGEDGRFGYKDLPRYWGESGRQAFLARIDGRPAGFALVARKAADGKEVWDMVEFFVLRRYRRQGVGRQVAEAIWKHCPGDWQIRVMAKNGAGTRFWRSAIGGFAAGEASGQEFLADGMAWHVFRFRTPGLD